jgi:hypothetical protein
MVSIFSCSFWPFEFLLLRKFCLVQLPISLLVHCIFLSSLYILDGYTFICYFIFPSDCLQYSFLALYADCWNCNMMWRGSILVMSGVLEASSTV